MDRDERPRLLILVDYAWFLSNRRDYLAIESYDIQGFFDFLTNDVLPSAALAAKPLCVAPAHFGKGTLGRLRNAGFSVEVMSTAEGQDDNVIRQEIRNAEPDSVTHILLVSGDGGYYPFLEEKQKQDIEIIIAATARRNQRGQRCTAAVYIAEGVPFRFIELYDFRDKIAAQTTEDKSRLPVARTDLGEDGASAMRIGEFVFTFPPEKYETILRFVKTAQAVVCAHPRISVKTDIARTERNPQLMIAKIVVEVPGSLYRTMLSLCMAHANLAATHPAVRCRSEIN